MGIDEAQKLAWIRRADLVVHDGDKPHMVDSASAIVLDSSA